jgi:predicted RNase H-like HicB family nuclease
VPAIPGCVSQGESLEELDENIREAIVGCLSVDLVAPVSDGFERTLDLAV